MSPDSEHRSDGDPAAYLTLAARGTSEIKRKGSRFLGRAHPVDTEEQANTLVDRARAEHHDARHVCYGLRVGRGAQRIDRSNDDGEPPRTGGFPIWQVLSGEKLENSLVLVIRYFGGTKLGMGGLKRAYRDAAKAAVDAAGIAVRHPETPLVMTVSYENFDALERLVESLDSARIVDREFGADVEVELALWRSQSDHVRRRIGDFLGRSPKGLGDAED